MPDDIPQDQDPQPANAALTPEERLKELQVILKKNDDDLASLTKERDALKADVDSLAKTVEEITKTSAAYGKGLPALAEEKKKITDYDLKKAPMIDAALGPNKPKVVEKITEVKAAITKKEGDVANDTASAAAANKEAANAQAALDSKQRAYDDYKNLQKAIGDKIQTANDFRARIEKSDDPPKPASMYVYLKELEKSLESSDVPSQADFDKEVSKRWKELDDAKATARNKKLVAEGAKTKLAATSAELTALQKNRIENTLKSVEPFDK